MSKITLTTIGSIDNSLIANVNSNSAILTTALDNTISRDGTSPNQMSANLDMNNNQILNLPSPASTNSPARLIDVVSNPSITVPPVGTSGATVPLLNTANTWSANQTFTTTGNNFSLPAQTVIANITNSTAQSTNASLSTITNSVNVVFYGADPTGVADSATAIRNAQAALSTTGGDVVFPAGTYKIGSNIAIGNGSSSTASTINGIRWVGVGVPIETPLVWGLTPTVTLKWSGSVGGTMVTITGPLQGWGIQNIAFDGNGTALLCLQIVSGQFGDCKNNLFKNFTGTGIQSIPWNVGSGTGFSSADCLHNSFTNLFIQIPDVNNAVGFSLLGNASVTANTAYTNIINSFYVFPNNSTANTLTAIYLGGADSAYFNNTHIANGSATCKCIVFDYTQASNVFPTSNIFFGLDAAGSTIPPIRFSNIGAPGATFPNMVIGAIQTNGVTTTNLTLAGLSFIGTLSMSLKNMTVAEDGTITAPNILANNFFSASATFVTQAPVTLSGTAGTTNSTSQIINPSGAFVLTLPAPSAANGRWLYIKSIAAQIVNSSLSNVVPLAGGAPVGAILTATAGKWAWLQSDGTNWNIMAAN